MENLVELEEKLAEIQVVKTNLKLSETEIKAQIKAIKAELKAAEKYHPRYYPRMKGWFVEGGRFDGYKLTGTILENQNGGRMLKAHIDGQFAHIDMSKFSGKLCTPKGVVMRVYHNGVSC